MSREFGASPFTLFAPATLGNDANTVYNGAGAGEFIIPILERYTVTEVGVLAQASAVVPGSGFKVKFVRRIGGVRGADVSTAFLPATIAAGTGTVPAAPATLAVGELDLILYTAPQAIPTGLPSVAITTRAGAAPSTFAGFSIGGSVVLPASTLYAASGMSGSEMTNATPKLFQGACLRAYTNIALTKGDLLIAKITGAGGASATCVYYAKGWPGGAANVEAFDVDSN